MFRGRSLRFRIAFAFIGGALLVSGFVAISTYVITSRNLTTRIRKPAFTRSFDGVRFVNENYGPNTFNRQPNLESLPKILAERAVNADVVATGPDNTSASSALRTSLRSIPSGLRHAVETGHPAWMTFGNPRRLAVGLPLPTLEGYDVYFVYSLADLDATLSLLRKILLGVVAGAVLLSAAVGVRLADRTIRPLRAASKAASLVAQGHLDTRLEESSTDELGSLATSFNKMAAALSARIARERQFVSDASHELRTPLTALKTSVDYVADRAAELPPRLASAIGLAAGEVRALQRLVNDLLELTRAEAGGAHVMKEDLDLVDFAREVARRRAPDVPVTINGPDHLVIQTDKARLERVVGNLLENAVVHGEGREISIELSQSNGQAVIQVADQGPGIPAVQLDRIFERFWRGDQSRHRHERVGAGLGLAIARENAGLIGAELRVESTPDVGTTFQVAVPTGDEEDE